MSPTQEINEDTTISTAGMAEVLGISERTLQQLSKDGWIEGKLGRDRWALAKTTRSYMTHVQLTHLTAR